MQASRIAELVSSFLCRNSSTRWLMIMLWQTRCKWPAKLSLDYRAPAKTPMPHARGPVSVNSNLLFPIPSSLPRALSLSLSLLSIFFFRRSPYVFSDILYFLHIFVDQRLLCLLCLLVPLCLRCPLCLLCRLCLKFRVCRLCYLCLLCSVCLLFFDYTSVLVSDG